MHPNSFTTFHSYTPSASCPYCKNNEYKLLLPSGNNSPIMNEGPLFSKHILIDNNNELLNGINF